MNPFIHSFFCVFLSVGIYALLSEMFIIHLQHLIVGRCVRRKEWMLDAAWKLKGRLCAIVLVDSP